MVGPVATLLSDVLRLKKEPDRKLQSGFIQSDPVPVTVQILLTAAGQNTVATVMGFFICTVYESELKKICVWPAFNPLIE